MKTVQWNMPESTARQIIAGLGVHPFNEVGQLIADLTRITDAQVNPPKPALAATEQGQEAA